MYTPYPKHDQKQYKTQKQDTRVNVNTLTDSKLNISGFWTVVVQNRASHLGL